MALLGGRFSGTVKSFKGQWGFVTAEGVDGDVFIHVKHSPALENATLRVGETVDFELSSGGPNNQARAVNATRVDGVENYGSAPLNGVIKSFRRGWGLIDSPSVDGSLYFGERDNPHIKEGSVLPGDEVTFELATNPNDGRNKAVNVYLAVKDQSECLGQRLRGNVKTFQDGWGFASSPRFQGTILLGRKQVSAAGVGLQVGDTVEFEVSLAPNGKHEATNISKVFAGMGAAAPFGAAAAPHLALGNGGAYVAAARNRSRSPYGMSQVAQAQGQYVGKVKTFRDSWGFLVSDQVEGDIYVKMRDSPYLGNPLQQGEVVSFDLVYRNDSSGKNNGATATNVQRMGAGGRMARPTTVPPPPAWPALGGGGGGRQAAPAAGAASSQHMGTVAVFKPPPDSWGWLESPTCQGQVFFGLIAAIISTAAASNSNDGASPLKQQNLFEGAGSFLPEKRSNVVTGGLLEKAVGNQTAKPLAGHHKGQWCGPAICFSESGAHCFEKHSAQYCLSLTFVCVKYILVGCQLAPSELWMNEQDMALASEADSAGGYLAVLTSFAAASVAFVVGGVALPALRRHRTGYVDPSPLLPCATSRGSCDA